MKIKIIIADSHFLSRKGLTHLLQDKADFNLLSEAIDTSDLINQSNFYTPDLIIIDYLSSNFTVEGIKLISKNYPNTRILAITEYKNNATIINALSFGVLSHLLKDCEEEEIVEAIYKTVVGEKFMCSKIVEALISNSRPMASSSCVGLNISERELEIITLIAEGLSNKEVADKLFISTHTVTTHRKNIMAKLGVNNAAGLVLFAVRENLITA